MQDSSSPSSWRQKLQSPITLIAAAALALGALGGKYLWIDSPPAINMAMAAPSPRPAAAKKPLARTITKESDTPAKKTPTADELDNAATLEPRGSGGTATALRPRPARGEVDLTSDTGGLFTIAALHRAGSERGETPRSGATDLSERVTSSTGVPAPAPAAPDPLGGTFIDEHHGFSLRLPVGWSVRSFAGEPWVLDCGDGRTALISIGFSPFPAEFTADNIPPEWVARRITKRPDTVLHAQGTAVIQGKKALWSKSTGPLPMSHSQPHMTRQTYIVPLNDGRVMEIRLAAAPEQFERLAIIMKKSVASLRLLQPPKPAAMAKTE